MLREAAKTVIFVMAGPIRTYTPPSVLIAVGFFFISHNVENDKKKREAWEFSKNLFYGL